MDDINRVHTEFDVGAFGDIEDWVFFALCDGCGSCIVQGHLGDCLHFIGFCAIWIGCDPCPFRALDSEFHRIVRHHHFGGVPLESIDKHDEHA